MTSFRSATVAAAALALAGTAGLPARSFSQSAPQQAQAAAPVGETVGGISCDAMEGQRLHIHQHLVIFDHQDPQASGRRRL